MDFLKDMEIINKNLSELEKYSKNPRKHSEKHINKICESIKEYGYRIPMLITENDEIIAGHGRYDACKKLGMEEVPCIIVNDLSDEQIRAYRIVDNKLTDDSGWDDELLSLELEELDELDFDLELTGFEDEEINDLLEEEEIEELEPEGLPDDLKDWDILNLYAGIGGNRKFWKGNITAVEYNEEIAEAYQDFFPDDEVIVTDAHEYLEEHFDEYDFIWSSPPCPTHSKIRKNTAVEAGNSNPIYPDLKLYEEILFLQGYFKGKWVVENVKSWYNPLIEPIERGPHYFWSNFNISKIDLDIGENKHNNNPKRMEEYLGFNLSNYSFPSDYPKQKILNNCIHPKLGEYILKSAFEDKK